MMLAQLDNNRGSTNSATSYLIALHLAIIGMEKTAFDYSWEKEDFRNKNQQRKPCQSRFLIPGHNKGEKFQLGGHTSKRDASV